jgi:hypothetical protein
MHKVVLQSKESAIERIENILDKKKLKYKYDE